MKATAKKCRPILMSTPMVRALLDGSKTQTRRLVIHNARGADEVEYVTDALIWPGRGDEKYTGWVAKVHKLGNLRLDLKCPFGVTGDTLWVRESFVTHGRRHRGTERRSVTYKAVADERGFGVNKPWKPSIHMPRWACRLYLEVVSVRVERVQDISETDAIAEGIRRIAKVGDHPGEWFWGTEPIPEKYSSDDLGRLIHKRTPTEAYAELWDSINGRDNWSFNPFVWVIEFRRTFNA